MLAQMQFVTLIEVDDFQNVSGTFELCRKKRTDAPKPKLSEEILECLSHFQAKFELRNFQACVLHQQNVNKLTWKNLCVGTP